MSVYPIPKVDLIIHPAHLFLHSQHFHNLHLNNNLSLTVVLIQKLKDPHSMVLFG
jgi:hypothetical protein